MTRDALCGVTTECPLATKLSSGCCPRAGGLRYGQGIRDTVGALCALCGSAQLAQHQNSMGTPFSPHCWGNVCLDQLSETPPCLL